MKSLAIVSLVLLVSSTAAAEDVAPSDPMARGDAAWNRRNEGADGSRAAPGPIGEAVAAYEEALERDPKDLEVYWKLLRALYFQGEYATEDRDEKQAVFARGAAVSEQALDLLAQRVGGRKALDEMEPEELRRHFPEPEVPRIYFGAAANWGKWGQVHGKLAAARQGVARRVRDYSRIVIALDPEYENGGGYRIHSRLNAEAPKIPFVTGWVDRDVALADIRRACEIAPEDPFNRLYLADTWLRFAKEKKAEALGILRQLAASKPRPEYAVDDAAAIAEAREILADAK